MRRRVDLLLRNGADMNLLTDKKTTPLFLAAQDGHLEIFTELILWGHVVALGVKGSIPLKLLRSDAQMTLIETLL